LCQEKEKRPWCLGEKKGLRENKIEGGVAVGRIQVTGAREEGKE